MRRDLVFAPLRQRRHERTPSLDDSTPVEAKKSMLMSTLLDRLARDRILEELRDVVNSLIFMAEGEQDAEEINFDLRVHEGLLPRVLSHVAKRHWKTLTGNAEKACELADCLSLDAASVLQEGIECFKSTPSAEGRAAARSVHLTAAQQHDYRAASLFLLTLLIHSFRLDTDGTRGRGVQRHLRQAYYFVNTAATSRMSMPAFLSSHRASGRLPSALFFIRSPQPWDNIPLSRAQITERFTIGAAEAERRHKEDVQILRPILEFIQNGSCLGHEEKFITKIQLSILPAMAPFVLEISPVAALNAEWLFKQGGSDLCSISTPPEDPMIPFCVTEIANVFALLVQQQQNAEAGPEAGKPLASRCLYFSQKGIVEAVQDAVLAVNPFHEELDAVEAQSLLRRFQGNLEFLKAAAADPSTCSELAARELIEHLISRFLKYRVEHEIHKSHTCPHLRQAAAEYVRILELAEALVPRAIQEFEAKESDDKDCPVEVDQDMLAILEAATSNVEDSTAEFHRVLDHMYQFVHALCSAGHVVDWTSSALCHALGMLACTAAIKNPKVVTREMAGMMQNRAGDWGFLSSFLPDPKTRNQLCTDQGDFLWEIVGHSPYMLTNRLRMVEVLHFVLDHWMDATSLTQQQVAGFRQLMGKNRSKLIPVVEKVLAVYGGVPVSNRELGRQIFMLFHSIAHWYYPANEALLSTASTDEKNKLLKCCLDCQSKLLLVPDGRVDHISIHHALAQAITALSIAEWPPSSGRLRLREGVPPIFSQSCLRSTGHVLRVRAAAYAAGMEELEEEEGSEDAEGWDRWKVMMDGCAVMLQGNLVVHAQSLLEVDPRRAEEGFLRNICRHLKPGDLSFPIGYCCTHAAAEKPDHVEYARALSTSLTDLLLECEEKFADKQAVRLELLEILRQLYRHLGDLEEEVNRPDSPFKITLSPVLEFGLDICRRIWSTYSQGSSFLEGQADETLGFWRRILKQHRSELSAQLSDNIQALLEQVSNRGKQMEQQKQVLQELLDEEERAKAKKEKKRAKKQSRRQKAAAAAAAKRQAVQVEKREPEAESPTFASQTSYELGDEPIYGPEGDDPEEEEPQLDQELEEKLSLHSEPGCRADDLRGSWSSEMTHQTEEELPAVAGLRNVPPHCEVRSLSSAVDESASTPPGTPAEILFEVLESTRIPENVSAASSGDESACVPFDESSGHESAGHESSVRSTDPWGEFLERKEQSAPAGAVATVRENVRSSSEKSPVMPALCVWGEGPGHSGVEEEEILQQPESLSQQLPDAASEPLQSEARSSVKMVVDSRGLKDGPLQEVPLRQWQGEALPSSLSQTNLPRQPADSATGSAAAGAEGESAPRPLKLERPRPKQKPLSPQLQALPSQAGGSAETRTDLAGESSSLVSPQGISRSAGNGGAGLRGTINGPSNGGTGCSAENGASSSYSSRQSRHPAVWSDTPQPPSSCQLPPASQAPASWDVGSSSPGLQSFSTQDKAAARSTSFMIPRPRPGSARSTADGSFAPPQRHPEQWRMQHQEGGPSAVSKAPIWQQQEGFGRPDFSSAPNRRYHGRNQQPRPNFARQLQERDESAGPILDRGWH